MADDAAGIAPGKSRSRTTKGSAEDGEPQLSARARDIAGAVAGKVRGLDVDSIRTFRPNICKVPDDVRKEHDGAYDPKLISFGPFHRGKESLAPMDEIKLLYIHDLLRRDSYNSLDYYAEAILKVESEARSQYSEVVNAKSDGFVEMLVIDGCFIIEFFLKRAEGKVGEPLTIHMRNMPTLRHDLLLIENQVPFFVLRTILKETEYNIPGSDGLTLLDLALHYLHKGSITKDMLPQELREDGDGKRIYHLLHLSYLCLLQGLEPEKPKLEPAPESLVAYIWKKLKDHVFAAGRFSLSLVRAVRKIVSLMLIYFLYVVVSFFELMIVWRKPGWSTYEKKASKKPRMIPTATELHEAGVTFRKKAQARCYLDVSFEHGRMRIPTLNIQENSSSEFRNFLALEQSCPNVGNYFTSYVVLMDNLVDTVADVSVLKRAGILESKLGCDADVAKFFNGMRSGLCFNFDRHYLVGLFEDLNDYCNQEHNRWRAKLMHDYFSNPWTIFSVIGAVVLLILTALQTVYTINGASDSSSSLGPKSAAPSPSA